MHCFFAHGELYFRIPTKDDTEVLQNLRNDASTWIHLLDPKPVGPADMKSWIESIGWKNGRMYFVVSDAEHPVIGLVRMEDFDQQNRSIQVGLNVLPELRRNGYGTRIYAAIKAYVFDHLNVHRAWLTVMETNGNAIDLYKKLGFCLEGRYREAIFRYGKYVDCLVMSCLEEEYRKETR